MTVPYRGIPLLGDNMVLDVAMLSKNVFAPALLYRIHPWFWVFLLTGVPWFGKICVYRLRAYCFRRDPDREMESAWVYVRDGEEEDTPEKIAIARRVLAGESVLALLRA